jgi:hypothetical protein
LELVLNALAVRSVADERQNGSDAFDEKSPLTGISVVKSGLGPTSVTKRRVRSWQGTHLNTVVAVRISQELFQPRTVEQLVDDKLPGSMLCDANALPGEVALSHYGIMREELRTFSMTLELNF